MTDSLNLFYLPKALLQDFYRSSREQLIFSMVASGI